ncbi:nucleotide exchange factor GrpE [Candidatus Fonsibacter ubiquis]|uniref:nucleotide exchange factor GrpE n=1 Tax=Candidatus Fonsibacter ubiquis TaxID=1925548 RepID=UPI000C075A65|nr:nucleotide exchange factor GrpE [Candidatus Fonsibacter ubiquis]
MNNKEETTPIKDQDTKIDSQENNGTELNFEKNLENNNEDNLENNLEKKIEELNDKLLRSLAENQNLRKIHEKEREDLIKYSSSSFAREILNLADNLERAFGLFKDNPKFKSDEFKDTMLGIELIEKELINSFDKNGIKSFESIGKKFDPNFHQALNEVESEQEDGMVINEIQKGYMLNDRLLRPALVSISKKKATTNS